MVSFRSFEVGTSRRGTWLTAASSGIRKNQAIGGAGGAGIGGGICNSGGSLVGFARLSDPPSYSAVRTMIRALEAKGLLRHRQVGTRYVYRPTRSRESASRSAPCT